jgi:protein gp37
MTDVFEDHPTITQERAKLWPLIQETPALTWQVLTKRADRIAGNLPTDWGEGYENVWLGVSVENMDYAWRVDELRKVPAKVRFISYEPALGPLDDLDLTGIHWVIYGGESGSGWRQDDLAWAEKMREKCAKAGVTFYYKQKAGFRSGLGVDSLGKKEHNFPR